MRTRTALLLALVVATAGAPGALAAPPKVKPACNIMVDRPGDGNWTAIRDYAMRANYQSPALDILAGDVVSGNKTVVAQLKVGSTQPGDPQTTFGVLWSLKWKIGAVWFGGTLLKTSASDPGSSSFTIDGEQVDGALLSTKVDAQTITWTINRLKIATLVKKSGQKFVNLAASSNAKLAGGNIGSDDGGTTTVYTDKQPHCRLKAT
jgi:hypothetical protein